MRVLLRELASSAHACALDAAVISAKVRLDSLDSEVMSSASPTEFVALRDELKTLMLDLPREQRHTPAQIFHLYESVITGVNVPFISFQAKNLLTWSKRRISNTKRTAIPSRRSYPSSSSRTGSGPTQ